MTAQYIQLGDRDWNVLIYYNVQPEDFVEVADSLEQLDCSREELKMALRTLRKKNTGFTFSNDDYKMSIVCIGEATNVGQFVNTTIHEAKHVQSHVCSYYNIKENSEAAAYLIGHLVHKMYEMLEKIIKQYI